MSSIRVTYLPTAARIIKTPALQQRWSDALAVIVKIIFCLLIEIGKKVSLAEDILF